MNKLLIITYYWPPAGGAGVQRWVKLSKYLADYPVEIHVLTVDPGRASYLQKDESLIPDIHPNIKVHTTDSFEIINWYARLVGRDKVPTAGFSNVDTKSFRTRVINFIRSHLFIPDPRRGWNSYAIKKARALIREHDIDTVITSSPPHSTQLIGLALSELPGIRWIADIRDPWTDIYYYPILQHSYLSAWLDKRYEKQVLQHADRILTVSESLGKLFRQKIKQPNEDKIHLLPNGYDPADFKGLQRAAGQEQFVICYTGSMADNYHPDQFILALADFYHANEVEDIRLQFIGAISEAILRKIKSMKLEGLLTHIPGVPHEEINQYQVNAGMLLLLIPDVPHAEGILTGKLFEYLATGRPILCLGPVHGDAASIIENCKAGATFNHDDFQGIKDFIIQQYLAFKEGKSPTQADPNVRKYDRKIQAKGLYEWLY